MGNVTCKLPPGLLQGRLELMLNVCRCVVRSDDERLRLAILEYEQTSPYGSNTAVLDPDTR